VRRVSVIGTSGSGKTTVGAAIADRLGLQFVELDALHHGPNWAEPTPEAFRQLIEPIVARDGWVIDGMYHQKLGTMVPDAADTIVWIDLPLPLTLTRLVRRTISRMLRREELWNGNRESFGAAFGGRDSLIGWGIRTHRRYRKTMPARLATEEWADKRTVRLRSQRDIDRFLESLPR
jgi:adenylate kinase family enzyme